MNSEHSTGSNRIDQMNDDELLQLLQNALHQLPTAVDATEEPPTAVFDGARWIHDWANLEAELAQLTFDSNQKRELAGIRSSANPLRELTFVTNNLTIEVEITPGQRTTTVSGTVEPPSSGQVQLVIGGEPFVGELDEAGNFSLRDLPSGTVLALVDVGQGGRVRLGSFEI